MAQKIYTMDTNGVTENCNQALDIYLNALLNNGVISEEKFEEMMSFRIVLVEKRFFGRLLDRLFLKDDTPVYKIVQIVDENHNADS